MEKELEAAISSADPTTTFRDLLGYQHLETGMARRVAQYRTRSGTAKLHLALSGLPAFSGLEGKALAQRLVIAPTMDAIESAFNPLKYSECGPSQVFDISIPSIEDASLAPEGQHVLTALVHYLPYEPDGGWQSQRQLIPLARLGLPAAGVQLLGRRPPGGEAPVPQLEGLACDPPRAGEDGWLLWPCRPLP